MAEYFKFARDDRREIQITPISKSVDDVASSDEMGVSAMPYMTKESNVVSLPLFGDATHSFTGDVSLVCRYPYDPGPLDSPPLNRVSNIRDSFQLGQEVLTRNLSQFDDPNALQVVNMWKENSINNASLITHSFLLSFSACPLVFIDFGTNASHTYQLFLERTLKVTSSNIVSFQDMKTLVAKLQTYSQTFNLTLGSVVFACNTFESLLLDTQGMTSLIQNYSAISVVILKKHESGHFSPSSFLVVNPFGCIASPYSYMSVLDCYGLVLLQVWIGKNSMKRIKSIIVDFYKPTMHHVVICKNFPLVDDYIAPSIVSLIYNGRRDTSIPMANFGVEGDHVLEAATNCFIERRKFIHSNSDILTVILLEDRSLVAAQKLKSENEKDMMKVIAQTKVLLTSVHQNVTCLICCYFNLGSMVLVLFDYPANSTLDMHLPRSLSQYLRLYWYIKLVLHADINTSAFFLYEKPLIMSHNLKSSCILSKYHFYVIIARLGWLFSCVFISDLQWYMNSQSLHFSKTINYDMCVVLLKGIPGSTYLASPTFTTMREESGDH